MHLNLSNNYFTREEMKSISEGIKENKTIYGLHMESNYGYVDIRGFVVLQD